MSVPVWLQIILGVFSLLDPQLAWLAPIIKIAYELISQLPFFHKAGAIVQLRQAVDAAKKSKSTAPIESFNGHLKAVLKAEGKTLPSDLAEERVPHQDDNRAVINPVDGQTFSTAPVSHVNSQNVVVPVNPNNQTGV